MVHATCYQYVATKTWKYYIDCFFSATPPLDYSFPPSAKKSVTRSDSGGVQLLLPPMDSTPQTDKRKVSSLPRSMKLVKYQKHKS